MNVGTVNEGFCSFSLWFLADPVKPSVLFTIFCLDLYFQRIQLSNCLTLSPLSFWNGLFHPWIWTVPLMPIGVSVQNKKNRIANSVDLDEKTHYKCMTLLHDLQRCLYWSVGMKRLKFVCIRLFYKRYIHILYLHFMSDFKISSDSICKFQYHHNE